MSDIHCVVCGEPWDAWGVRHGDMLAWEAKLFRVGAGCPSCKGEAPEKPCVDFDSLDAFENGDEDPMIRIVQRERVEQGAERPAWQPPEPTVLWTCDGCGVEVVRDESGCTLDGTKLKGDVLHYHVPSAARARHWYNSHPFHRESPEDETPAFVFQGDVKVCEFCLDRCHECGAEISRTVEFGDSYDHGAAICDDGGWSGHWYCVDCFSALESEEKEQEERDRDEEQEDEEQEDEP